MPALSFTLHLLEKCGPLAVTSANTSGGRNALTAQEVTNQLEGNYLLLDGGPCPGGIPSTVVDCSLDRIKVHRVGTITEEQILSTLKR
jgi:L-threonylcarbamoyladenylate synthase